MCPTDVGTLDRILRVTVGFLLVLGFLPSPESAW